MQDTIVRKRTYQQYCEEVRDNIYAETGERITCCNNHDIAVFTETVYCGDHLIDTDLGETTSTNLCNCPLEDHIYFKKVSGKEGLRYSTGIQFYVDGELRVKKNR